MNLINEENLTLLHRRQNRGKITRVLHGRARSDTQGHSQLVRNNHGQSGFTQAWRPGKKNMVRRNLTLNGSIQEQAQLLLEQRLTDKTVERVRAQLLIAQTLFRLRLSGHCSQGFFTSILVIYRIGCAVFLIMRQACTRGERVVIERCSSIRHELRLRSFARCTTHFCLLPMYDRVSRRTVATSALGTSTSKPCCCMTTFKASFAVSGLIPKPSKP